MQVEINPSEYTVLIVDDTIANVLLLKVLIGNQKYRIVTAGNGMEALQAVEKESPDLILLDIMMPGMNGYEVAEKLKADPQTQEIPIIFLTALNSTNDIVKGFKTGRQRLRLQAVQPRGAAHPRHRTRSHLVAAQAYDRAARRDELQGHGPTAATGCIRSSPTTCARRWVRSR